MNETVSLPTHPIICLPDSHVEQIHALLESEMNKENGFIHLTNKDSTVYKFYRQQGNLMPEKEDGNTQVLISQAELWNRNAKSRFYMGIIKRLRDDFPDKTDEEIQQDAEILCEANEAIKRLIAQGVPKEKAVKAIESALLCNEPPKTPEEMAQVLGEQLVEADGEVA